MFRKWLIMFLMMLLVSTAFPLAPKAEAFSPQIIQHGATGDDVIELQSRLQYIGFYNGAIDGVFGWRTYWALRNFQYEFGLNVDGLAGAVTKQKLVKVTQYDKDYVYRMLRQGKTPKHYGGVPRDGGQSADSKQQQQTKQPSNTQATEKKQQTAKNNEAQNEAQNVQKAVNTPKGFSQNDMKLLANAVYGEARGEPYIGQIAIAAVILNRVKSPSFPNSISGVIFEPGAFTAVSDGQIWLQPNETAKKAVQDALTGWDPSGGAVYYFNPATATNKWIWSRPQIKRIGKHIFCK